MGGFEVSGPGSWDSLLRGGRCWKVEKIGFKGNSGLWGENTRISKAEKVGPRI